ncbi:hypothetical protein OAL97_05710, partial [Paracoccaceae bacterium]|nr:hypothetical protein [Paracoccaceae bacterium]
VTRRWHACSSIFMIFIAGYLLMIGTYWVKLSCSTTMPYIGGAPPKVWSIQDGPTDCTMENIDALAEMKQW